jgi:hypothetical protein
MSLAFLMSRTPTEIKSLARAHTETAIRVLAGIMNQDDSAPAARVQAANSLLDRGWGKATQVIAGDDEGGAIKTDVNVTGVNLVPLIAKHDT